MLKISQTAVTQRSVMLKLEGSVVGPWVDELCQICETHLAERRIVNLDLADVSYADPSGVRALFDLLSRGVNVAMYSPFVEEQMKRPIKD